MQQRHTEGDVRHTDTQQDTGNHRTQQAGPRAPGGERAGAENVEAPVTSIQKGTDVDKVAGLDEGIDDSVSVNGPVEQGPERDERGRL